MRTGGRLCGNGCGQPARSSANRAYCDGCKQARYLETRALARKSYEDRRRDEINARRRSRRKGEAYRASLATPQAVINKRMSTRVRYAIKNKAGIGWAETVGYSVSDLLEHIERQFLRGMSWENMGQWHIDHIVPLSSFTFETFDCPDFRRAWALSNLRPLWATDNLKKQAARQFLL